MKISLCICTRNRPDELRRCLTAVYEGNMRPDEVIVSDDSDEPGPTCAVTADFGEVIYQRGPRRGLSPNRNACVQRSTGTHIMFIDDDVRVNCEFFEIALNLLQETEATTIVTGCQIDHTGTNTVRIVPHNADFWGYQQVPVRNQYRSIVINATIFPRLLFNQAKFDENLKYGSEEIDIARHAAALGFRIIHDDFLCVDHYPSLLNRDEYRKYSEASRLYAAAKAHWIYERSPLKSLAYIVLAPLQLIGSAAYRQDWPKVRHSFSSIILAAEYARNSLRAEHSL